MGRITKDSMRTRIQRDLCHLRSFYRAALKDDELQDAFDVVWRDWDNEQAAMVYAQVLSVYDLLNLTGVLANRRELIELRARIEELEAVK